jgi:biotin-dependent carboxylase-like uncharacterized protein
MIEVVAPGSLCTIQDEGRHGWAHLGVGHSGAADRHAYALANRLVGNPSGAAMLECTFGGLSLRTDAACVITITGALCPIDVVGGPACGHQQPVALPAGTTITLGSPLEGVRTYVAIRGGIDVAPIMGSRSTDTLSGLGPAPLNAGDVLAVGPDPGTAVPTEAAPPAPLSRDPLRLWPGPRRDWFASAALTALTSSPYVVQPSSNRIGVRLAGRPLERTTTAELPSEGMVEGAVQVPADGQPLIFLADHGTIGGYPVIAVVDPSDLPRVAQARPGHALTFHWR